MPDKKMNYCDFCAKVNREEVTACEVCGHSLHGVSTQRTDVANEKKKWWLFILSRSGAVDFLHLNGH